MQRHRSRSGHHRRPSGTWTWSTPGSWFSWTASASALERHQGTVWQDTAIDVASAYAWATLQVTRRNPSATWTSALACTVAADLAARAGSWSGSNRQGPGVPGPARLAEFLS